MRPRALAALAVAAPLMTFGVMHVTLVQPRRDAARAAERQAQVLEDELSRRRTRGLSRTTDAPSGSKRAELADAIARLLRGKDAGGVANLAIETGAPGAARDPMMTVTFEARYAQAGSFLWQLRSLPVAVDLRSLEIVPSGRFGSGIVRVRTELFAFPRTAEVTQRERGAPPAFDRDPFAPPLGATPTVRRGGVPVVEGNPVVTSILFSGRRRVALVDGRIVQAGDRIGPDIVNAVEPRAVVLVTTDGRTRRVEMRRPALRRTRQ